MGTGRSTERGERGSPPRMGSAVRSQGAAGSVLGGRRGWSPGPVVPGSPWRAAPALPRHGRGPTAEEVARAAVSLRAGVQRGGHGCPGRGLEMVLQTQV